MSDWTLHAFDAQGVELVVLNATCVWPRDRHKFAYELRYLNGRVKEIGVDMFIVVRFRGHDIWRCKGGSFGMLRRGQHIAEGNHWLLDHGGVVQPHSVFTGGDAEAGVLTVQHPPPPLPAQETLRRLAQRLEALEHPSVTLLGHTTRFEGGYPASMLYQVAPFEARIFTEQGKRPRGELRMHGTLVYEGNAETIPQLAQAIDECATWWQERALQRQPAS